MKIRRGVRRAAKDTPEHGDELDAPPIAKWTGGSALASRVAGGLLIVALACGPIALGERLMSPREAAAAPQSNASAGDSEAERLERAIAGETGLEVIQAYLSASRADHAWIASLMKGANEPQYPEEALAYSDPQIVAVIDEGAAWTVTVSARVTTPRPAGDSQVSRRAWSIPVSVTTNEKGAHSALVLGWPHPVAVTSSTQASSGSMGTVLSATSVIGGDVQAMLSAYLTGADLTRFVSPGTWIEPLEPGLYGGTVKITRIHTSTWKDEWDSQPPEGQAIQLVVDAAISPDLPQNGTEKAPHGASQSSWVLIMTARAGRWEVSSIGTSPASNVDAGAATHRQSQSEGTNQ